jgi:hypothetical protein
MKEKRWLLVLILAVAFGARVGYSLAKGIGRECGGSPLCTLTIS